MTVRMERSETETWVAPLFGGFSAVIGTQPDEQMERINLAAGQWLFREGDRADHAYHVHSGRIELVAEHPTEVVFRQVKRGEMLGELALLMGGSRATSARATRDTELNRLSRVQFEKLVHGSPLFALGLLRAMAAQISSTRTPTGEQTMPETVAVVPLDRGAPAARIGAELTSAMSAHRSVEELRHDTALAPSEYRGLLKRTEAQNQQVVLTALSGSPSDPWTSFCLREADVVIAVTNGLPDPDWLKPLGPLEGCELMVLDAPLTVELDALAPREVQVVRGETALGRAIAATARRLAGVAVGLVLSGGGARALAHIGALEELEKTGIGIDRYGGVSMGAIISGLAAQGASSGEIIDACRRLTLEKNPSNDYTLPAYSLIRGLKTRRALEEVFGEARIEELDRRWFCISAEMVARELIVHRTGPMLDAIYSSTALPGIFPPIPTEDGRLLIDGGVLDNLPVETMARRVEGPIIASDVSLRRSLPPPARRPGVEQWARRIRRLLTGYERPLPRMRETIYWAMGLGSSDTVTAALQHADLVISPPVEGIRLLDWDQLPRALEIGRTAARKALEEAPAMLESWTR